MTTKATIHRQGAVFRRHYGGTLWNGKTRPVGEPYADRGGEDGGQVKTAWKNMLRRAGISNFTPHDCRHTWATWHYAANRDITALMQLGGWRSPAMVTRYAHVNADHLSPTIDRLWGDQQAAPRKGRKRAQSRSRAAMSGSGSKPTLRSSAPGQSTAGRTQNGAMAHEHA